MSKQEDNFLSSMICVIAPRENTVLLMLSLTQKQYLVDVKQTLLPSRINLLINSFQENYVMKLTQSILVALQAEFARQIGVMVWRRIFHVEIQESVTQLFIVKMKRSFANRLRRKMKYAPHRINVTWVCAADLNPLFQSKATALNISRCHLDLVIFLSFNFPSFLCKRTRRHLPLFWWFCSSWYYYRYS